MINETDALALIPVNRDWALMIFKDVRYFVHGSRINHKNLFVGLYPDLADLGVIQGGSIVCIRARHLIELWHAIVYAISTKAISADNYIHTQQPVVLEALLAAGIDPRNHI